MSENLIIILTSDSKYQDYFDSVKFNDNSVQMLPLPDFIEFVDDQTPDLVLLDCGFDAKNGLDVLREIKVFYPHVPVIFLTGLTCEDTVIEAFRCGARDYLKKPVNVLELQKSIECILLMKKTQIGQRRSCLMNIYYREISIEDTQKKSLPPNIHSVLRYVDKNLTSQISLEILAKIACSSKYHFCKVFKKHMGMSPLRYVALKRVKKAEELLIYSDMNISEVAWEAGFNDLSNFNKHFKKYTGITPTFYKCAAKSSDNEN